MSMQIRETVPNLPAVIFRTADLAAHYRDVRFRLRSPIASRSFKLPPRPPVPQPKPTLESRTLHAIEAYLRIVRELPGINRTAIARSAVAQAWRMSEDDLCRRSRVNAIVEPRQMAMAIARHLGRQTLPSIGRRYGGMDHTTVLHAATKYEALVKGMVLWRARFAARSLLALPRPGA